MRKKSLQHNSFIVIQKFAEQHESGKRSLKKVLSPLVKRLKKTNNVYIKNSTGRNSPRLVF